MRKNLELKAIYLSARSAQTVCMQLKAKKQGVLRQKDTYFNIKGARLKLRELNNRQFELIYYRRKNLKSSRFSDFVIVPLGEPIAAKRGLQTIFGIQTVVRKKRLLYLYRNARIHIDTIVGLGVFLEFEVIVNRGTAQARKLMKYLIAMFDISDKMIIAGSYADMMTGKRPRASTVAQRKKALAQPQ